MRREFREWPRMCAAGLITGKLRRAGSDAGFKQKQTKGTEGDGDRRDACPTLERLAIVAGWLTLATMVGCRSPRDASADRAGQQHERAVIEARAGMIFTNAVLVKPREDIPATNLAVTLAPLLIQQVTGSAEGTQAVPATIYYQMGAIDVAGMNHLQMTYLWSCGNAKGVGIGVRITLNTQGSPVIWEVLDEQPGPRVVFVSQSLEEKAKRTFGAPALGRRFAVERPFSMAPKVVVARAIDDGPEPMGPIVHLTARPCDISTVICRCMPTQARQLVGTTYYELKPLSAAKSAGLESLETNGGLRKELRLPSKF